MFTDWIPIFLYGTFQRLQTPAYPSCGHVVFIYFNEASSLSEIWLVVASSSEHLSLLTQPKRFNPCLYGAYFWSRVFSTDSLEANCASNLCRCRTHLRRVHIGSTGSQVTALGESPMSSPQSWMILVGQLFAVAAPAFGGGLSGVQKEMKAGCTPWLLRSKHED